MFESNNKLEYENKQLKLQLETTMDQARKFNELATNYRKAYDELSKKVTSFCSCITSLAYAKKQIGGKNKMNNMSIDDLLAFAVDEYNKQRKEFQNLALEMTEKIDEKDKIIDDLTIQISRYEIENAKPPHITNEVMGGNAYDPASDDGLGLPNIPNNIPSPIPSVDNADGSVSISIDDEGFSPMIPPEMPDLSNIGMPDIPSGINDDLGLPSIDNAPPVAAVKSKTQPKKENKPSNQTKPHKAFMGPSIVDDELDGPLDIDSASRIQVAKQDIDATPSMSTPNFDAVNPNNLITPDIRAELKKKVNADKEQKLHMIDISALIQDVMSNEVAMGIFRLIGEKGYSQLPQIKELLENSSIEKGKKSSINIQINNMMHSKIIESETINTGYRHFKIIDFTSVGVRIFEEIFKKSPVESEQHRLKRENASLEHGYLIQDTMTILKKEFGYLNLIIDRKTNSIKLPGGKTYIPDIVATIDGKVWDYIEVERGTHTQKDFNDKLDKMLMVTKTFHFVSQNQESHNIVIEKTQNWINGQDANRLKGVTIKFSTLSHLSKRNWSKIISL